MNKIISYLSLAFLILFASLTLGQESELTQVGTSTANFLKVGMGARATAMGDAFVALSNDISSLYWNPGGLATIDGNEAIFQVTDWLLDSKFYFVGVSYQIEGIGALGVSLTSFSSGDFEETTIFEPDGTGRSINASDLAAGITYSRRITDRFSVGVTVKYISEQLDRSQASTMAIDVGSVFITNFLNNLRIGFALSNLGGRMKFDGSDLGVQYIEDPSIKYVRAELATESWDIPLLFRFGFATDVYLEEDYRFTISTEVMDSRDFIHRISAGGEIAIKDMVFLRSGYKYNYDETDISFGAGFNFTIPPGIGIKLDYAYSDYGILDNTQRFSIIFSF